MLRSLKMFMTTNTTPERLPTIEPRPEPASARVIRRPPPTLVNKDPMPFVSGLSVMMLNGLSALLAALIWVFLCLTLEFELVEGSILRLAPIGGIKLFKPNEPFCACTNATTTTTANKIINFIVITTIQ